jgi:hypothetical protein
MTNENKKTSRANPLHLMDSGIDGLEQRVSVFKILRT